MIPQKDRIEAAIRHIQTALDVDQWAEEIAVEALKAQADLQPTCNNPATDCIGRQTAIGAIQQRANRADMNSGFWEGLVVAMNIIEDLPSAQPKSEERTAESAQNVPNDELISKKAAIELIERMKPYHQEADDIAEMIANMPSAQPEEDCTTCKHGYFNDEECINCSVRYSSHYERRTDG